VTREVTTGDDGRFVLDDLPLGAATVTIAAVERKPRTFEVELTGAEVEAPATSLESVDLPTQIRGYTKSFRGAPVQAKISVAPGDYTVTADADGYFELDVPPGTYEVTCTAPNFVTQTRTLVVTEKSVTTYNFDLR
jgi:hypothetical protein